MKALIILTIIIFSTPFSFADTIKIKDKFLNSIESLLNDNFKGTDFTIKSKENTKPEIGILTLKPIIDNDDGLLFFQGSLFTHDSDRETLNLGLGNRIFLNEDTFMFGVNGFYDYELDYNHRRLGIGTEIKSSILELNTNSYRGLSETRVGKNNDKEVAVDGYDIELGAHIPFIPSAKVYTKIFEYEIPGGSDFKGMKYSSKIGVPNFGIDVEVGFTDFTNTGSEDEWFFDLVYSFGKKTSDKSFITKEAYEKISMKDNKYDKVRRENLIVKSKESFSIKAAGF